MKRTILCTLLALVASAATWAQNTLKPQTIALKSGVAVQYDKDQIDSTIVVLTPDNDTLGIKVFLAKGEEVDYLYSQVESITWYTTVTPPVTGNANKNGSDELAKNKEAWRLEFPHLYQGSDITFEVTHSTSQYGITYSLEWDGTKKANRWTCYEFYADNKVKNTSRTSGFKADPDIPSKYQHTSGDFNGFSRGHLCPSADRLCSAEQNRQTFYLSNMQPQWQNHNGGIWNNLENQVRSWADICDTLYVVKAATIDNDDQVYTADEVSQISSSSSFDGVVPKYFYTALLAYNKSTNTYHAIALWTLHNNNAQSGTSLESLAISIDELEKRTGIDFFCNLPDDIEQQVESTVDLDYWF
jgi:endonuclease G